MIEIDWSNHRHIRSNCVGRIKPSTQSGFQDHDVRLMLPEMPERERSGDFEKGRMRFPIGNQLTNLPQPISGIFLRNQLTIDLDSFSKSDQMGRGKQPDLKTLSLTDRIDHCADGTFAV